MNSNLFLYAAFLLLVAGCVNLKQPAVKVDYYQIEYEPANSPASEPLDAVLGVRRFTVAAAYDHDRMVYKEGAFERQTYYYHRWITNPAEMIRDAILKDLQRSGNYRAVVQVPGTTAWNYEIQGYVREIYENDLGQHWESILDLDVTLIKTPPETSKRRALFQKNYRTSAVCENKDPKAVVAAMSTAMQKISYELQKDVYVAVQEDLKKDEKETEGEIKEKIKETKDARNEIRYLVKALFVPDFLRR